MSNKEFVHLHVHTDASLSDGALSVEELAEICERLHIKEIAITDHGLCANWLDAFLLYKKKGIKTILGVEAYITTEGFYKDLEDIFPGKEVRQHLVLLAKDYLGMQAISRFVTETNRHIDAMDKPIGTVEMLQKFFGPDSKGYGHVFCLSACIAGVLATPFAYNKKLLREIEKIQKRINTSMEAFPQEYFDAKVKVEEANIKVDQFSAEIEVLEKYVKSTSIKDVKKRIKEEKNEQIKEQLLYEVTLEEENIKRKKEQIDLLKKNRKEIKSSVSEDRKIVTKHKNKLVTISQNEEKIAYIQSKLKDEKELYSLAKAALDTYVAIFGSDFYAEIQNHGIPLENELYNKIVLLARENGIKLVATNDIHMGTRDDLKKRELLKNISIISSTNPTWKGTIEGDSELYVKTPEEMYEALSKIFSEDVVMEAMENTLKIASQCNIEWSNEKHYPEFKNADVCLRELAYTGRTHVEIEGTDIHFDIIAKNGGYQARYGERWCKEYEERMEYELKVISQMKFSSYFLFIADVISTAKNARENALDIGPGRGSGAGSIVCYTSGITEIDPMENGLMFERFLNPERVSMPDIDTDFSKFARNHCLNMVKEKYGARAVAGIMTKGKILVKGALTYAPKLLGLERGLDKRTYVGLGEELKREYDVILKSNPKAGVKELETVINEKYADIEEMNLIFQYSLLLEGYIQSYGQHAAGVIAIQNDEIENYIPLMKTKDEDGNETFVVQANMVQCEANLGFIKFDFLGLKNLHIITEAQRLILLNYGVTIDPYNLPFEPEIFDKIFANADTNFIFQFESDGMKSMLKDLKPTCFSDIVLAVSVYRPGPMEFIPDIIDCKNTGKKSEFLKRFPMLEPVLSETYGFPVYQEQVMKIMVVCAGFSAGKSDEVRRHMSKKHEEELAAIRPDFVKGCEEHGISAVDANWLYDQLMPFAKYGFNKSHAAAYSLVSHITAWLKYHYPVEYLCAAMMEQGEKTSQFVQDCRNKDIVIYRPDINESDVLFTPYKDGIRIGFSGIKGLNEAANDIVEKRCIGGPFTSILDFAIRTNLKSNNLEQVVLSGACDSFTDNRESSVQFIKKYVDAYKLVEEQKEKLAGLETVPEEEQNKKSITTAKNKLTELTSLLDAVKPKKSAPLSLMKKLGHETKLLGMWVTGNPLDEYDTSKYRLISSIDENDENQYLSIAGVISNMKEITTKKGQLMAIFSLIDSTGNSIKAIVFPRDYEEMMELKNDMCILCNACVAMNNDTYEIQVKSVKKLSLVSKYLVISVKDIVEYAENISDVISQFEDENGINCRIHNKQLQEMQPVSVKVSNEIFAYLDKNQISYAYN